VWRAPQAQLPWLQANVADISGQEGKSVRDASKRRLGKRRVQIRGRSVKSVSSTSTARRRGSAIIPG
jgi:hypothetical protein